VPDRLKVFVGTREIKISLRTRDPAVARIRNLEEMLRIERLWAKFDGVALNADGTIAAYLEVKGPTIPTRPTDGAAIESLEREPQPRLAKADSGHFET
jgi:hypothetical protein